MGWPMRRDEKDCFVFNGRAGYELLFVRVRSLFIAQCLKYCTVKSRVY